MESKYWRIAVWHHAVTGPRTNEGPLSCSIICIQNGVRVVCTAAVHEMQRELLALGVENKTPISSEAGSFGARAQDRPESAPRLYDVLEMLVTLNPCACIPVASQT